MPRSSQAGPAASATEEKPAAAAAAEAVVEQAAVEAVRGGPEASVSESNNYASSRHQSEAKEPEPQDEGTYREEVQAQERATAQSVPQGDEPPAQPESDEDSPRTTSAGPEKAMLSRLSTEMADAMSHPLPIADRWRRWVEWGSPFATSAAHLTNVSGEEEPNITRFRFAATLTRALKVTNLADMSWVFIRRLALDPFNDLKFQLTPFKLKRGAFYEFRFFSRAKANPTKDSVKATLDTMGFSPMKLVLLKKNMHIPHRSSVSVRMWLGIGRWTAPNSVVTNEDPFFFESLKEVQP